MREVTIISNLQGFDQKNRFFGGVVLVEGQQFGTGTWHELEILHQYGKKAKTKSQKVLAAIFYVCRSSRGKTDRGPFCPFPILNKVKIKQKLHINRYKFQYL